jgi:hypothetical protein
MTKLVHLKPAKVRYQPVHLVGQAEGGVEVLMWRDN